MANITPVLTLDQSTKVNELVNRTNTRDPYNDTNSAMNPQEYEIRLLHHIVQSLSNKLGYCHYASYRTFEDKYSMFYRTLAIRSPNESFKYRWL